MRVAAYVHWRSTAGSVTGVGRHIRGMVCGLSRAPGVDVTVMASRREMAAAPDSPLTSLPQAPLPFSRALLERIWWAANVPRAERFVPDADWIYSPADAYVPTRKALFASTIHDVEVFEDDLPWSRQRPGWEKARRNWRLRLGRIFKRARLVLTVSQFSKRRIVELLGADPAQIVVVGNGVEECFLAAGRTDALVTEAEQWRQQHGPYLATVGGLSQRKGADYLLDLADELQHRRSGLKILVAGRNDEQYVAHRQTPPNVVPLGFVGDEKLAALLKGAEALVFLSRYEGFGIPVLEAMACGTPAVISNFASLPEVAGDAGLIVDVHQPAQVAHAVLELTADPSRRADLVRKGLVRAQEFTWDACVARLVTAMRQAS